MIDICGNLTLYEDLVLCSKVNCHPSSESPVAVPLRLRRGDDHAACLATLPGGWPCFSFGFGV